MGELCSLPPVSVGENLGEPGRLAVRYKDELMSLKNNLVEVRDFRIDCSLNYKDEPMSLRNKRMNKTAQNSSSILDKYIEYTCEAKPTTLKRPSPGDGFVNHMRNNKNS